MQHILSYIAGRAKRRLAGRFPPVAVKILQKRSPEYPYIDSYDHGDAILQSPAQQALANSKWRVVTPAEYRNIGSIRRRLGSSKRSPGGDVRSRRQQRNYKRDWDIAMKVWG